MNCITTLSITHNKYLDTLLPEVRDTFAPRLLDVPAKPATRLGRVQAKLSKLLVSSFPADRLRYLLLFCLQESRK